MSLSDDLKTLEELHSKGRLTDQEFKAAKASAIASASGASSAASGSQSHPMFLRTAQEMRCKKDS